MTESRCEYFKELRCASDVLEDVLEGCTRWFQIGCTRGFQMNGFWLQYEQQFLKQNLQ